jgi:hypothetical protein
MSSLSNADMIKYPPLIFDYFQAGPVPEAVGSGNCSSRQFSNKKYPAWFSLRYLLCHKGNLYLCVSNFL